MGSPSRTQAQSSSTTPPRPSSSHVRSRGQLARRESFTGLSDDDSGSGSDHYQSTDDSRKLFRKGTNPRATSTSAAAAAARRRSAPAPDRPVLGGLTVLDILFIGVAYALNLLRTLGIAELFDVAWKAGVYCITSLPFDFYRRWTLSHPTIPRSYNQTSSEDEDSDEDEDEHAITTGDDTGNDDELGATPLQADARSRPHPVAPPPAQLSPFHHLVILLTRFACSNFPHLLPRVLFADQTMLPFVGWRTGGASWSLMREISSQDPRRKWRAVWMGTDAYTPSETRRKDASSREASTILYLHGGGFSLGSVSFYAEALLRVLNKVAAEEGKQAYTPSAARARCVAVEYDLSPAVRFPSPLLQCLRCYAHLVEVEKIDPRSITFAGDSAGGNLAMGMLLVLSGQGYHQPEIGSERDWSSLPLPGKAVLISPWVDLRPDKAHAFAHLRSDIPKGAASRSQDAITDSLVDYDWDYVASETLLHFAQVYAGVLERPRRVMGPMGWLANVCGVLSRGLEAERDAAAESHKAKGSRKHSATATTASAAVLNPPRKLARAVQDSLESPIFEKLLGFPSSPRKARKSSNGKVRGGKAARKDVVPETTGNAPTLAASLMPVFAYLERQTDKVRSTAELFAPFSKDARGGGTAERLLATEPLLSPILGDWSKIQLERGALVTWGERELLSADIESWVELVQTGRSSKSADTQSPSVDVNVPPRPDGEEERERAQRLQRGKWLMSAVEHGPGGVHAWPFVAMYLAGTEAEREKGLETLARFIARPTGAATEAVLGGRTSPQETVPQWEIPSSLDDIEEVLNTRGNDTPDSPVFFSSDAARQAAAGRAFSEEEYKAAFGLGVQSYDDGQSWPTQPQRTAEVAAPERGRRPDPVHPVAWQGAAQPYIPYYQYGYPIPRHDIVDDDATRGCLHAAAARQRRQSDQLAQPTHQHRPQSAIVEQAWEDQDQDQGAQREDSEAENAGKKDGSEGVATPKDDDGERELDHDQEQEDCAASCAQDVPATTQDDDDDDDDAGNTFGNVNVDEDQDETAVTEFDPSQFGLTWTSYPQHLYHDSHSRSWGEGLSDISEEASVLSTSPARSPGSPIPARGGRQDQQQRPSPPEASAAAVSQAPRATSPPSLVWSPETRRFIRLEAERQLAEEGGSIDSDNDEDDGGVDVDDHDSGADDVPANTMSQGPSRLSRSSSRGSIRESGEAAWWA